MLVLSRKVGERVYIGGEIVLTIVAARQGNVRFGIAAPRRVIVVREEIAGGSACAGGLQRPPADKGTE
jgi:carbon storage regulator